MSKSLKQILDENNRISPSAWAKSIKSKHKTEIYHDQVGGTGKVVATKHVPCVNCQGRGFIKKTSGDGNDECTTCSTKGYHSIPVGHYHPRIGGSFIADEEIEKDIARRQKIVKEDAGAVGAGTVSIGNGAVPSLTDPTTNYAFQVKRKEQRMMRRKRSLELDKNRKTNKRLYGNDDGY